ncbi:LOW QUALITY PROTEIN: vitelline envelope sperm lysin receptor-like [Haliotis rubra]|uniref:LOW QUALITY PROTEIN: vitelline envelope sperm lysin receptor-like n=1 Tax=Haliotis rubra TaxID=36100 RepID=UPI001EE61F49|nr:LOW QUALITY PROTEIN: vitelline envelope sperm lysin receptor-like [Haliotis rubra]
MTAALCLLSVLLVRLSVLLGVTSASTPEVRPLCSTNPDQGATITIKTDVNVYANAFCQDVTPVEFTEVDSTTLTLDVAYPGGKLIRDCEFKQRGSTDVYFIRVIVSFGEAEEIVTVTCTLDRKGSNTSGKKQIKGRVIAQNGSTYNKGQKSRSGQRSDSKLKLSVTDIARHRLKGKIVLGRKVLLVASTDGSSGEKGLRITSCEAVGRKTGERYQVIKDGCGVGQVFKKKLGFVTKGLTAISPYFNMFQLENDKSITFDCNFTFCKTPCDGSSCNKQRPRRAPDAVLPAAFINSVPSQLKTRFRRSANEGQHIKLFLTNVAGYKLHNVSLQRGRPYVLHAVTDGLKGEVGLQVMRCDIVTTRIQHNLRMAAIRDGCGVEPVFRPDQGFITSGLTATSPYFKGFSIRGDKSLTFECDVILCHQNCDGRTCVRERKKRELEKQEPFLESGSLQSASYVVNPRAKRSR